MDTIIDVTQQIQKSMSNMYKSSQQLIFLTDQIARNRSVEKDPSFEAEFETPSLLGGDGDSAAPKAPYCLKYLSNILEDKMQERDRLRAMNSNLLVNSAQKENKIKELTDALSRREQQIQKSAEIAQLRDAIQQTNVDIQRIKKQLHQETKKLQQAKLRRSRAGFGLSGTETAEKSSVRRKCSDGCPKRDEKVKGVESSTSRVDSLISASSGGSLSPELLSIMDETLDEIVGLDIDSDEVEGVGKLNG